MKSLKFVFQQWLLLLFVIISTTVSKSPHKIPRLSPIEPSLREPNTIYSTIPEELETFFYNQTLDHFNYNPQSYSTFKQRYFINSKHWGGANTNAPILAYLSAEGPLEGDLQVIGFLNENAPRFKALTIYIEHRYYGESNPLGSMDESVKNESARGYFNSAQAIADYAEVLLHIKKKLSSPNSPVIVVGGSYGGMLASWFRLKYPHIALGALASSAPILYFDDITPQDGYYSIVSKDFKNYLLQEVSESCYHTIQKSWDEINKVASKPNGLSILSQRFKTCTPLMNEIELKDYLYSMYCGAAQYNAPPRYPTTQVCGGIDGDRNGTNILGQIFAGLVAYRPNNTCYNTTRVSSQSNTGWRWQTCSEMVIPIGISSHHSMFPLSPYDLNEFVDECKGLFGVMPRPHWVTTYYGGHGDSVYTEYNYSCTKYNPQRGCQDIKLVLNKFGSNIIFSNGLRDPYSSGGVLEDISDSILAVYTANGSHCLDILKAKETDPQWLIMQRSIEAKIINGWLKKYYADLLALQEIV